MLALRIMQGIAKPLAEHVLDLKHSPLRTGHEAPNASSVG